MNRTSVPRLHHVLLSALLLFITIITSCGGGGGGGGAAPTDTGTTSTQSSQTSLSGTVQPDPASPTSASGQNAGATVYIVGQQNNAVQTDSNGNFSLNVNPALSGTVLSGPSLFSRFFKATPASQSYGLVVLSSGNTHGKKTQITVTDGRVDPISTIYINTVGAINGKTTLQGQTDHTGIHVYIPGTSFAAWTDAAGNFTISNVPTGTYDILRAEKDGYRYSVLSNVAVDANSPTTVPDQTLFLSTGATGQIIVADGAAYSTSRTVKLNVAASDNAVLMMISDNAFFSNTSWMPVQSTTTHTFTSDGEKTLWIKFSDANGLESAAYSSSRIYIDSNPLVSLLSPAAAISETAPVFAWSPNAAVPNGSYHLQVSQNRNFAASLVDTVVSSPTYTLPASLKLNNNTTYYCRVAISDNGVEWNWAGPWSFTVDMGKVSLLAPVPYANTDTLPLFDWSDSALANASYRLQISRNAAFTDLFEDSAATNPSLNVSTYVPVNSLSNNRVYYWRVALIDGNGVQGDWSPAQTFTVNLGTVTLFSPSGITNDSKPQLSWADSPLAGASYRVQLTTSTDPFTSPLVDSVVAAPSVIPSTALGNGGYQWRVAVIDGSSHAGNYSTPLAFSVDIGTVTLSVPSGAVPYSKPSFDWSDSTLAGSKYRIQIARDSGFTDLQEDSSATTPSGLTASAYVPVNVLQNATTYYWKTQVIDANGIAGNWSPAQTFSVDLGTVALLSPSDGSFVANTTTVLDWSDSTIPGSKTYDVQLATDTGFTNLLVNAAGLASSQYTIPGSAALANGQTYYWRVRVVDANGVQGQWATSGKPFTVSLGTVDLVAPAGAISDTKPVLSWTASALSGASYWVQLSSDSAFGSFVVNTTLASATSYPVATPLANNTTYYFRVAVVDANNVPGDWAGPQSFTVAIGAITLLSPLDLATLTNTKPTLNWSASTLGPNAKYHVQIATDTGFSGIVEQADTAANTAAYTLTTPLQHGQTYYWRVAVIDGNGVQGNYSTFRSFSIDLGTVSLTGPSGTTNNTTPTLDWSDSALPGVSYRVQLSPSSGFGTTLINTTTAAGISQYPVPLANKLSNGMTYYWRVAVIDGNNVMGGWSATQSFTVDLGTVSLQSPASGATIGQTTPTFSWSSSSLTNVKYHIQVARDSGFTQIQDDATDLTAASHALPLANKLNDATTFYWRVAVIDQNGVEGSWSSAAAFSVSIGTVSLTSPLSLSSTNDTTPAFSWNANSNAATYKLTLSTNGDLSGGADYAGIPATTYTLLTALPSTESQIYYWAVTPVDGNTVPGTRSSVNSFTLDTVSPTGSVVVNGGNASTSSETVTLTLSASDPGGTGVSQMWVSTNSGFTDGAWEAYATTKQFTFSAYAAQNTGSMTAYVKFKDFVGNVSGSYSDSIDLARTLVTSDITANSTWSTTSTPYVVQNNIIIASGATLTINPGVVVKFAPATYISVAGSLIADGAGSPITFTSNKLSPQKGDWGHIKFAGDDASFDGSGNYLSGPLLQNCIIEYGGSAGEAVILLDGGQPFINKNIIRYNKLSGIRINRWSSEIKITNNMMYDNGTSEYSFNNFGGGVFVYPTSTIGTAPFVGNNVICGNTVAFDGGGIYGNGRVTVTRNTICNNKASTGAGVRMDHYTETSYNTIVDNVATASDGKTIFYQYYNNPADKVSYNNIFRNSAAYELWFIDQGGYQGGNIFNAADNYWGTTVDSEIQQKIYDWHDSGCSTCGIVTYSPIATAPSTTAPISPPAGLTAAAGSSTFINVTWTANSESDRAGYRVFWDTDSGRPYANSATVSGGGSTGYTINGLTSGTTYYVSVTAYDSGYAAGNDITSTVVNENQTNGNESWYASEKQVTLP